jgi:hypothetical protein
MFNAVRMASSTTAPIMLMIQAPTGAHRHDPERSCQPKPECGADNPDNDIGDDAHLGAGLHEKAGQPSDHSADDQGHDEGSWSLPPEVGSHVLPYPVLDKVCCSCGLGILDSHRSTRGVLSHLTVWKMSITSDASLEVSRGTPDVQRFSGSAKYVLRATGNVSSILINFLCSHHRANHNVMMRTATAATVNRNSLR